MLRYSLWPRLILFTINSLQHMHKYCTQLIRASNSAHFRW